MKTSASRSSAASHSPLAATAIASGGTRPGVPTNPDLAPMPRPRRSSLRNSPADRSLAPMVEPLTAQLIDLALTEDAIGGDITSTATIPAATLASGTLIAKATGVISGLDVARQVFIRVDPSVVFTPLVADGTPVGPSTKLATVEGPARRLLAAERIALNLLQRLSGVATATSRYVAAVAGTGV